MIQSDLDKIWSQDKQERDYQLLFLSIPGIGPKKFFELFLFTRNQQITWKQLWESLGKLVGQNLLSERVENELNKFKNIYCKEKYFEQLIGNDIEIVYSDSENYPYLLSGVEDKPLALFCKGNIELLQHKLLLSVVGTRRITAYGKFVTKELVSQLVDFDFCVVSGFMYGVDVCAHRQAMKVEGKTIAVLGYGLNHLNSQKQVDLVQEMIDKDNLFISEFAPFIAAHKGNFPKRNRIVAGISLGTLVTEAARKSGSHITANFALDYGRFVGAVPGPISNPYSEGTKYLINQGAKLVSHVTDILPELNWQSHGVDKNRLDRSKIKFANELEETIYKLLESMSMSTDELVHELKLEVNRVSVALSMMEMKTLIKREGQMWLNVDGL